MSVLPVLDHGFVRLDGALADDLSVVNAARVSFAEHRDAMSLPDEKLIGFLMRNRHGTPFEHNVFSFHIKAPLFVVREWQRHRIASYNEQSGRYSKLEDTFYVPEFVRTQTGKPGAYQFEAVDEELTGDFQSDLEGASLAAYEAYELYLADGVAKELARLFLPVNFYTQFYFTLNARALMNFLSLRNHETAMYEIREYAKALETFFEMQMPATYQSFVEGGRVAP